MVRVFEQRIAEGRAELERLEKNKWDAKFVLVYTRILLEINYGMNNKFVDFVVGFVITFLGMEIICMSIGGMEIEMS